MDTSTLLLILLGVVVIGVMPFAGDIAALWWQRAKEVPGKLVWLLALSKTFASSWYLPLVIGAILGMSISGMVKYLPNIPNIIRVIINPPGPGPKPDPNPQPPVPVPSGIRDIYIFHESGDTTFELNQVFNKLQTDTTIAKHRLFIFDKDVDTAALKPFKDAGASVGFPALVISDPSGKIISISKLPPEVTADQIKTIITKSGG